MRAHRCTHSPVTPTPPPRMCQHAHTHSHAHAHGPPPTHPLLPVRARSQGEAVVAGRMRAELSKRRGVVETKSNRPPLGLTLVMRASVHMHAYVEMCSVLCNRLQASRARARLGQRVMVSMADPEAAGAEKFSQAGDGAELPLCRICLSADCGAMAALCRCSGTGRTSIGLAFEVGGCRASRGRRRSAPSATRPMTAT